MWARLDRLASGDIKVHFSSEDDLQKIVQVLSWTEEDDKWHIEGTRDVVIDKKFINLMKYYVDWSKNWGGT